MDNVDKKIQYFGRDLEAMSFAENYYKWLIDEINPFLGEYAAEVGAGRGNFTSFLTGTGVKRLIAFEPSENMFAALKKRFEDKNWIQPVNSYFSEYQRNGSDYFDTAIYINVLEHIANDADELALIRRSLKPRGHLILLVPTLSFLYSDYDQKLGHYRRYHKPELIDKVTAAGFAVAKTKYIDFLGIVPWYLAFTLLKRSLSGASVSLYDRICIPIVRRIESVVSVPIGKNMLLVAEKK